MKTKACQKQSSVKWATALKILKVSYLSSFLKIINIYITPTKCFTKQKKKKMRSVLKRLLQRKQPKPDLHLYSHS